ncbi:hypothetical protein Pst134EA_005428 [Puccinia striiformis f. sp. tritici]|uniref:hypothetical protein n=1 Tax=Puccinia striiformis f. sp. tritici TaxID=168172 RepID=UPI002007D100|nr:hypothetical protein Pst134EA_005428 [Puccinia striiformis f. sp. tritici]KAH9462624.1 hypothetical protein Pst134EB_006512 [Puccinia striiformis f. sp. tritici]KAH9471534.1 hypothetical protein Pst134EA_005428 [Puccinia striiformis f. sp. tritici]KAI9618956.1 hypothetical protein H4Q26_012213 [Puccinia striiformis f. sp. tritici PST-130]
MISSTPSSQLPSTTHDLSKLKMPPNTSRPETTSGVLAVHPRRVSWHPRPLRLPQKSPPPIPPRNYAPLPMELLSKDLDIWDPLACERNQDHKEPTHLRLELDRSSLRQRRLATRKTREDFPTPALPRRAPPVRGYVYRQPALILKRQTQPAQRYPLVKRNFDAILS